MNSLIIITIIILLVYLYQSHSDPSISNENTQSGQSGQGGQGGQGGGGGDDPNTLCQLPSADNPFMNAINGDPRGRAGACIVKDNSVKDLTETYFKLGLYNDINDVWDKNSSQREFVTMPSTTFPNDRDKWAKWLFTAPGSCRGGDMNYCLQYDSILYP